MASRNKGQLAKWRLVFENIMQAYSKPHLFSFKKPNLNTQLSKNKIDKNKMHKSLKSWMNKEKKKK